MDGLSSHFVLQFPHFSISICPGEEGGGGGGGRRGEQARVGSQFLTPKAFMLQVTVFFFTRKHKAYIVCVVSSVQFVDQ